MSIAAGDDAGMNTPLWVPLVVAAVGIVGTLSGVWLTQRRADKREAIAWEREQERVRTSWAREDAARTFEHRREAYVSFYQSVDELGTKFIGYHNIRGAFPNSAAGRGEPPEWSESSPGAIYALHIYGSPEVVRLADKVNDLSLDIVLGVKANDPLDEIDMFASAWHQSMKELHEAIRHDLGIPTGS